MIAVVLLGLMLAAPSEDGVHTYHTPRRTLETIEATYAQMKPVDYTPPADRWALLPRTRQRLEQGDKLKIVMVGDSIVSDTARSSWQHLLRNSYPGAQIDLTAIIRGSTGCWWYHEDGRVQRYVLTHQPDLVIIGGISQRKNFDAIQSVIEQIRAGSDAEILLMSGAFGRNVDPNQDDWAEEVDPDSPDERAGLQRLARKLDVAYLDMHRYWGLYVRKSGSPVEAFKRDPIHANQQGEQIMGRILAAHFAPKPQDSTID